jgi:hypothetical protein
MAHRSKTWKYSLVPFLLTGFVIAAPGRLLAQDASESMPIERARPTVAVHGHWTIEVKNPDGSVAEHREFENALMPTGASTLTALLVHAPGTWEMAGAWSVYAQGDACGLQPGATTDIGRRCYIQDSRATTGDTNGLVVLSRNLVVALAGSTPQNTITLTGTFTPSRSGTLSEVGTSVALCHAQSSLTCAAGTTWSSAQGPFTRKVLSPALVVQANQIIAVAVQLTFTSALDAFGQ